MTMTNPSEWRFLLDKISPCFAEPLTGRSRRLFHGRGGCFCGLEWCAVDDFCPTILLTLFNEPPPGFIRFIKQAISVSWQQLHNCPWRNLVVQHRYENGAPVEWLIGSNPEGATAQRDGLHFGIRFDRKNVGYFLDMEPGRHWLEQRAKGKSVLNLFSFTCAFSPIAISAGANRVVNVDMSRSALSEGRENHRINSLPTDNVEFMPLDILKSWSRIRKRGPYDIIIVDPPSFQKGSFVAVRDYIKVIKRLDELAGKTAEILLCLNAPELGSHFLLDLMAEQRKGWRFVQRLQPDPQFCDIDSERQLKLLIFRRESATK